MGAHLSEKHGDCDPWWNLGVTEFGRAVKEFEIEPLRRADLKRLA